MSEPKLNTSEVIAVASQLFWRDGYDGVSIDDVVQETGFNRYALYRAFGGKRDLFIAALDAYHQKGRALVMEAMADPNLTAFEALGSAISLKMKDDGMFAAGCLLCTTAVELAAHDEDVSRRVLGYFSEMKGMLGAVMARAQAEGELAPGRDSSEAAEVMFSIFLAIGVQARAGAARQDVEKMVHSAIASLRFGAQASVLALKADAAR
ncbi:MAG: TetR/AcrR family transcriptional regulator [Pseudomonadota bacterium]